MNDTQRMIANMLRENTGRQMLDSGGVYGRNWERNQKRQFQKEASGRVVVSAFVDKEGKHRVEVWPELSAYHFLSQALEYAPKEDAKLQRFFNRVENKQESYGELLEKYIELSGEKRSSRINTYNYDSLLSQVAQYTLIGEGEGFCYLQIHGGCDVRGGYTKPRVFRYNDDWTPSLWDDRRATISCEGTTNHYWDFDSGDCQTEYDGKYLKLSEYPGKVLAVGESPIVGSLCAREDDSEAFCPVCASKLAAYGFGY